MNTSHYYPKSELYPWAMLAVDWDKVKNPIMYPVLVQPKLNGIRAKWDAPRRIFITRQGEVFPEHVIPYIYDAFRGVDVSLDGEIFCETLRLQEIMERIAPSRLTAHEDVRRVEFRVFDMISADPTELRMNRNDIDTEIIEDECTLFKRLAALDLSRYDGLIIRQRGCPYIVGRTEALIKLKPWQHCTAKILDFIEGKGKLRGVLGALLVQAEDGKIFRVGGGEYLTNAIRAHIWEHKADYYERYFPIKFRELSLSGIPIQPQIEL